MRAPVSATDHRNRGAALGVAARHDKLRTASGRLLNRPVEVGDADVEADERRRTFRPRPIDPETTMSFGSTCLAYVSTAATAPAGSPTSQSNTSRQNSAIAAASVAPIGNGQSDLA